MLAKFHHDIRRNRHWHCEADIIDADCTRFDGIDAEDSCTSIEQRSARVSGVNRSVGLNECEIPTERALPNLSL